MYIEYFSEIAKVKCSNETLIILDVGPKLQPRQILWTRIVSSRFSLCTYTNRFEMSKKDMMRLIDVT